MSNRRLLVAGNWKLNGSLQLVEDIKAAIAQLDVSNIGVIVNPPFPFLSAFKGAEGIELGAQNLSEQESGAFTGETSASMLKEVGCEYVILGHSERRTIYGETDELVAQKVAVAINKGLTPLFCIGETEQEREDGETENVIKTQIDAVINAHGIEALGKCVIAYEPVWAIGTGKTATPEQAQAVHAFIRDMISKHSQDVADKIQILYGGSMNASNADALLGQPDIDGGLIGGASLKPDDFSTICRAAIGK